jgi:Fe-S-cluster containining protein
VVGGRDLPDGDGDLPAGRGYLPAGGFSAWLREMRRALLEEAAADVPCGECSACCSTSHFVHVGPRDMEALARIPRGLLFPAPGRPAGHFVLGYDDGGCCPMLSGGRCSIYEHRPLTCRTYDCRVFAAAGVAADAVPIARRVRRWRFRYATEADRLQHEAVRAAARFVRDHPACFPGGEAPRDPAQLAVLAVKAGDVFLASGEAAGAARRAASDEQVAAAVVRANEDFEARRAVGRDGRGARSRG